MLSKPDQIRKALTEGNHAEALRIASSFPHLGSHKAVIMRGYEASVRPAFYRQLGKDPQQLINDGIEALKDRYDPTTH